MTFSRAHNRVLRKFIYCGVDFVLIGGHAAIDQVFENASFAKIEELKLKVIDIRDLIPTKSRLTGSLKRTWLTNKIY